MNKNIKIILILNIILLISCTEKSVINKIENSNSIIYVDKVSEEYLDTLWFFKFDTFNIFNNKTEYKFMDVTLCLENRFKYVNSDNSVIQFEDYILNTSLSFMRFLKSEIGFKTMKEHIQLLNQDHKKFEGKNDLINFYICNRGDIKSAIYSDAITTQNDKLYKSLSCFLETKKYIYHFVLVNNYEMFNEKEIISFLNFIKSAKIDDFPIVKTDLKISLVEKIK